MYRTILACIASYPTQVRDGPNVTSPLLASYCGDYQQPFSVLSSGDALTVRFVTDATNEGEGLIGFSANYTSIPSKAEISIRTHSYFSCIS